jgi:hypothetical protein
MYAYHSAQLRVDGWRAAAGEVLQQMRAADLQRMSHSLPTKILTRSLNAARICMAGRPSRSAAGGVPDPDCPLACLEPLGEIEGGTAGDAGAVGRVARDAGALGGCCGDGTVLVDGRRCFCRAVSASTAHASLYRTVRRVSEYMGVPGWRAGKDGSGAQQRWAARRGRVARTATGSLDRASSSRRMRRGRAQGRRRQQSQTLPEAKGQRWALGGAAYAHGNESVQPRLALGKLNEGDAKRPDVNLHTHEAEGYNATTSRHLTLLQ